jgi:hypothetical protein
MRAVLAEQAIIYLQPAAETLSLSLVLERMRQVLRLRAWTCLLLRARQSRFGCSGVHQSNWIASSLHSSQWLGCSRRFGEVKVSDPDGGIASPSLLQQLRSPAAIRWWTVLALLVAIVAGFLLVRSLGGVTAQRAFSDVSIEQNWNSTIKSLGVSPIFPPEEDLVVGDVLAVVVRDIDPDSQEQTDRVARKAFVSRSVKLAHVDITGELETAYKGLPVFPAAGVSPLRDGVARRFTDAVLLGNLPRAAFPRLKIQGTSTAAGGLSADGRGSASYGAGSQHVEEFELSDVRTYGLTSVKALQLFDAFCDDDRYKSVCQEATGRKHLERVIGDQASHQFLDKKSGDFRYAIEIEIVMVYRVYLTSSIVDLRRASRNEKGGLSALWPFGSSQGTLPAPATDSAPAAIGATAAEQMQALNNRLADLERKLASVKNGGVINYESFFGNESSLEGKFERPVAIGYRSVKRDITPPPTAQ